MLSRRNDDLKIALLHRTPLPASSLVPAPSRSCFLLCFRTQVASFVEFLHFLFHKLMLTAKSTKNLFQDVLIFLRHFLRFREQMIQETCRASARAYPECSSGSGVLCGSAVLLLPDLIGLAAHIIRPVHFRILGSTYHRHKVKDLSFMVSSR